MIRVPTLIQRFHALPVKEGSLVAPWRLQLALRDNAPYELLLGLCQSQIWALIATNLKQHNLFQSHQATTLAQSAGLPQTKGHGKGKHKQKGKLAPKMASKQEPESGFLRSCSWRRW